MALELRLTTGVYDRVDALLSLSDTTGNYHAISNPTGYGTPNNERNEFALFVTAKRVGGFDKAQISVAPLTDSTFGYVFDSDGVYELYLVALPFETSPDVSLLAEDYIYYETVSDNIYIVQNGVAVETRNIIDGALFISDIQYYLVTSHAETRAIEMFCSTFEEGCGELRNEYNDLNRVIDAIKCLYEEGYYTRANGLFALANKITI